MGSIISRERGKDKYSLERKANHSKPSVFLPEEIWEIVARHMDTKEWVQVSGTCKVMSKVQLLSIELDSDAAQAVVWAAKHSRKSKELVLTLYAWDHRKSRAVMAAVDKDDWDLGQVQTLCIWMEPCKDYYSRLFPPSRQADPDAHRWMWIPEILSSASNANVVSLLGDNLAGAVLDRCGLPPLLNLEHLGLTAPLSPEMCLSIEKLPALRELYIQKQPGLPEMEPLPALDLTCCSALRDVA